MFHRFLTHYTSVQINTKRANNLKKAIPAKLDLIIVGKEAEMVLCLRRHNARFRRNTAEEPAQFVER